MRPNGIFCLEGDWYGIRDSSTVEPVLSLLNGARNVGYIHRDVGTVEEFEFYVTKWAQRRLADHPILYLGFHGDPGVIYIGDRRRPQGTVTLDRVEALLAGRCRGRMIHFGTCGTLDRHGHRLNRFLRTTKAVAVSGYMKGIDWVASAAFEVLALDCLADYRLTKAGVRAAERKIRRTAGDLARGLDFRVHIAP